MRIGVHFLAGTVAALSIAAPAPAATDLFRTFAVCTGRLSAEVEHGWLMGDQSGGRTEALRDHMEALLDAVTDPEADMRAMVYRLDAKVAHRRLLDLATFAPDIRDASRARRQAAAHLSVCTGFLLG